MTDSDIAGDRPAPNAQTLPPGLLRSPAAKFFLTGAITVLLMIPLWMVFALTSEREMRRDEVAYAIGQEWGLPQSVQGPLLVIPYLARVPVDQSQTTIARRHLIVLPESLSATVTASTETRTVAIYEVPVYSSHVVASGRFGAVDPGLFGSDMTSILWDEAFISVSVDDLTGIEDAALSTGGRHLTLEPGAARDGSYPMVAGGSVAIGAGVHAPLGASGPIAGFDYALDLRLRGTDSLRLAPVGRQSEIAMSSNWPHPNFAVGMLPSERTVTAAGFEATWRVPYLARPAPQSWTLERDGYYRFGGEMLGVGFVEPVDFYALVERSLKYGLMFIGVTFLAVFVLETLSPHRIHVVQYCLVGLILVMFFVLLLAFSERVGFGPAYLVAAGATTLVVSAFVGLALGSRMRAAIAAVSFAATFALLYAILRLEDLALLAGSVIGFLALSGLLFATRKVDWSGVGKVQPSAGATRMAQGA
jgi:inner membrane protein